MRAHVIQHLAIFHYLLLLIRISIPRDEFPSNENESIGQADEDEHGDERAKWKQPQSKREREREGNKTREIKMLIWI